MKKAELEGLMKKVAMLEAAIAAKVAGTPLATPAAPKITCNEKHTSYTLYTSAGIGKGAKLDFLTLVPLCDFSQDAKNFLTLNGMRFFQGKYSLCLGTAVNPLLRPAEFKAYKTKLCDELDKLIIS